MEKVSPAVVAAAENSGKELRLLNWRSVSEKISRGRSWIFQAVRDRSFPAPAIVGEGRAGSLWDSRAVDTWIVDQITAAKSKPRPASRRSFARGRNQESAAGGAQ